MAADCVHVVGRVWLLNQEEGIAWISRYLLGGSNRQPDKDNWSYSFSFCPCCGAKLEPVEGVDAITLEDAV